MKIYFEDGELIKENIPCDCNNVIDARWGFSYCVDVLERIKRYAYNYNVYTNSIISLDNRYAWNKELEVPEIYIRNKDGVFTRIDKLTDRWLREGHNIMKMYIAGEFE